MIAVALTLAHAVTASTPTGRDHSGVFAIATDPDDVYCSAVLVAPDALLTAASCVADRDPATLVVHQRPNLFDPARELHTVTDIVVHPDGALAVLLLADDVADADPLAFGPTVPAGATATLVGYGAWSPYGGWTGDRRHGPSTVLELEDGRMTLGLPSTACFGDEGGAALDAEGDLVGVMLAGDGTCENGSRVALVSSVPTWLEDLGVLSAPSRRSAAEVVRSEPTAGCSVTPAAPGAWLTWLVPLALRRRR